MRRFSVLFFFLFIGVLSLCAKPKSKTFDVPKDRLFASALRVISEHHRAEFTDEKLGLISFHTGMSMASNGFDCSARVEAAGQGRSIVTVNVQKIRGQVVAWGAGDRMADKLFDWIAEDLKKEP